MPPKRKVAAKAEATDAPKKAKAAKGLAVGEQFPDIGPLETDEGKMVDLKVRPGARKERVGVRHAAERESRRKRGARAFFLQPLARILSSSPSRTHTHIHTHAHTRTSNPPHTQDILAKTGVLLFSYPKANTSGCTTQANGHNDQLAAYKAKGFAVYGISADKPATQANWRSKYSLAYNLLCDPDFAVLKQLDWVKDGGAAVKRSHAVIAKGGKVLDLHTPVTPKDSVALGLEFIEGL
jgi:peroxiredoxin